MINALLLFKMEGWVTDEMKARIQATSLSNAKQLICGAIRDEVIVDVAATTAKDLNLALGTFAELQGVKDIFSPEGCASILTERDPATAPSNLARFVLCWA
jgi:hypothetical protein